MSGAGLEALLREIRACAVCAAHLPHGPRPVVQASGRARLLIIGQAPGSKVHASGRPWTDESGRRLREWTGLDETTFYDPEAVAILPMGFCYPGRGANADLPPRPECAPLWHDRARALLPEVRLTLLVGAHAQAAYIGKAKMQENVERWRDAPPGVFPLPHPSWRVVGWMRRNAWFEDEALPELRRRVAGALGSGQ